MPYPSVVAKIGIFASEHLLPFAGHFSEPVHAAEKCARQHVFVFLFKMQIIFNYSLVTS